jgi:hypothetical protein
MNLDWHRCIEKFAVSVQAPFALFENEIEEKRI